MSGDESATGKLLAEKLGKLTASQSGWVQAVIGQFQLPHRFSRHPASDIITAEVLERIGDALRIHHAFSRQALSKDRFEFAFEHALKKSNINADLAPSRTNRGHDLTVAGVPISLKTEAAGSIKRDYIHISKWMELGRGEWQLPLLLNHFLDHMKGYERIFTLRRLLAGPTEYEYELVEIPKALMLEAQRCELVTQEASAQNPKPGYGYVRDAQGALKYSLYFDGGSERKLQIRALQKSLCQVHGVWRFESAAL